MKKLIVELIIRRTVHLVCASIIISSLITFLYEIGFIPIGKESYFAGLVIGAVLYIVFNVKVMRRIYFVVGKRRFHYIINFGAYFVFGVINMITYIICSNYVFAWLFGITKFFRYTRFGFTRPESICVFHMIMAIAILCAPIGLGWVKEKKREKEEFIARMPGMLEVNPLEQKPKKEVEANDVQKETEENSVS